MMDATPPPSPAAPPAEAEAARIDATELAITRWLNAFALQASDEAALLGGFCERLCAAGMPLLRVATGYAVFHPVLEGRGIAWRCGPPAQVEQTSRIAGDMSALDGSPFQQLMDSPGGMLRRTVGRDYRPGEFPLLDRYVQAGCADYLGLAVGFAPGTTIGSLRGIMLSFQTARPGGFTAEETELLRRLAVPLAHALKTAMSVEAGRVLVTTYLGADPGRRVLDGTIRRGGTETVEAVLWSSDLVGFTRIADTLPRAEVLDLLNDYADCIVGIITAHGGDVLKFIGDGIIAMFPVDRSTGALPPCGRALDAAEAALDAVEALGERRAGAGLARTGIHLALHVGEVLYGNIGSRERLDFTVVGPAVNELARIEAMSRTLDQPMVASSAFATAATPAARARLVSLGRYALRGVRRPEELFTLDLEARAAGACG